MIIDSHRTSKGRFAIMADVVGSCGEVTHTQVGRFYRDPNQAILAALEAVKTHGYTYCIVRNRSNGWITTIAIGGEICRGR
jgi:hypothetical protein